LDAEQLASATARSSAEVSNLAESLMVHETALWLAQFYFKRRIRGPSNRPLYAYRVTDAELAELAESLRLEHNSWQHPALRVHWAACYSMYVAESYRRHYDPASGWTWAPFDGPLNLTIPAADKRIVVLNGLKYWGRPIRRFEGGHNDYLGSLFAEGGLPWALLNAPVHGFGRAVRSGVRHFDEDRESGRSAAARIAEFMPHFPHSFRTEEVCLLLAGIVSQLIAIVEQCRLRRGEEPIAVLDRDMPTWRDDFPIPLDDANANQLISDWLTAARQGREDWERRRLDRSSSCAHQLAAHATSLGGLVSIVDLQRELEFPMPGRGLTSTRLDLGCYEGDRLLQRIGVVYAEHRENLVRIKIPKGSIEVRRDNVEQPLSLKVLDAGAPVHSLSLPNSSFDVDGAPSIFDYREESWWYLSSVACNTKSGRVRIRLAPGWEIKAGDAVAVTGEDHASWIDASSALSLVGGGEEIRVEFNNSGVDSYRLVGTVLMTIARPEQVFLGWPRLERDGAGDDATGALHFVNGRSRQTLAGGQDFGEVKYQLRNAAGLTLYRKRFGLLPADFRVRLAPAVGGRPAQISIASKEPLVLTAMVGASESDSWNHAGDSSRELPSPPGQGLADICLSVRTAANPDPVVLRYPYPLVGVRMTNAAGGRIAGGTFTLEDLPGMEAVLFAGPGGDTFRVVLELSGIRGATPRQYSSVRVGDQPVRIHLNSFADDIAMLLGVSSDQDATVRMSIESSVGHLAIDFRRYKYQALRVEDAGSVVVAAAGRASPETDAAVIAMCIPDPGTRPFRLQQRTSQDTATGYFEIPAQLGNDGPWILCAPADARIGFRPLFVPGNPAARPVEEIGDFGLALRLFHPVLRPTLIADQVVEMAADAAHLGWDYLRKLRDEYSHLPLPVFEVWKAVAANPHCLVLAVLRLDLSLEFCRRIENELAVVWEAVPLRSWREAIDKNAAWLHTLGLSQLLLDQVRDTGIQKFKQLWPGFNDLGGYLSGAPLRRFPAIVVLPGWHQALRQQQAENDHWPTQCASELRVWVQAQQLPEVLQKLPTHSFMNAVTYLPMFLGFVSAGRGRLELPGVPAHFLKHAVRHVANFDQHWFAPTHAVMTCHFAQHD
jgi:hypothetical protein